MNQNYVSNIFFSSYYETFILSLADVYIYLVQTVSGYVVLSIMI